MKIAFLGTRGIPAQYGGFETALDEISTRFVAAGYQCDIFCRASHSKELIENYQGRHLVYVKGSENPKLDTFISSIQTGIYLLHHGSQYQHLFWFNNANFPGIILTLLAGFPITINTDGLEWQRKKWRKPFKLYYYFSSALLSFLCPILISDSRSIQEYYEEKFNKTTHFIPYGIPKTPGVTLDAQEEILSELGLDKGKYFLQITRIEPDNLPLEFAMGYRDSKLVQMGFKLVIVGYKDDTPYAIKLKRLNNIDGIMILPANYDPSVLYTLRKNSFCYLHGNSVGGTNPALLEAMATCSRILAIDVPFNREVLGEHGSFFLLDSLSGGFQATISLPDKGDEMKNHVQNLYQWDAVADSYMAIVEDHDPTYRPTIAKVYEKGN